MIAESHTYVECCDRVPLVERTVRVNDHGVWVRVCRDGMGCRMPVPAVPIV